MCGWLHAQHCDSINNHRIEGYSLEPEFAIQLADGNILLRAWQDTVINGQPHPAFIKFYKISRFGGRILDSVTYENHEKNDILMTRIRNSGNPAYEQYPNILVKSLVDNENCKTDLNLSFFNDDAIFNEDMEITVPLADTLVDFYYYISTSLLDGNNDLIIQYNIPSRDSVYFDRFGLDGTLKHRTIISRSVLPVYTVYDWDGFFIHGLKQSHESPSKYVMYGSFDPQPASFLEWKREFVSYEFDSLFNIVNTFTIPPTNLNTYPFFSNISFRNGMVVLEDGTSLVVRDVRWTNNLEGTGIRKYDANGNLLKSVWFDSTIPPTSYGSTWDDYLGIGLEKDDQGNVFCAFQCMVDNMMTVVVIKLDEDLNIIWERYGMHMKTPLGFHRYAWEWCGLNVLDQGGAVVFGYNYAYNNEQTYPFGLFMMLVDDNETATHETTRMLRPYIFFPNPGKDLLHLHYSPDVTPRQVTLYDLQGRMLYTQSNDLENIRMGQLPAGTYTLRITMEDGKVYSDRVVKQ